MSISSTFAALPAVFLRGVLLGAALFATTLASAQNGKTEVLFMK